MTKSMLLPAMNTTVSASVSALTTPANSSRLVSSLPPLSQTAALSATKSDYNELEFRLPELSLKLDSYQAALLMDVLLTISEPLPIDAAITAREEESADGEDYSARPLRELRAAARKVKSEIRLNRWRLRTNEWNRRTDNAEEHDGANETPIEHQSPIINAADYAKSFSVWLSDAATKAAVSSMAYANQPNRVQVESAEVERQRWFKRTRASSRRVPCDDRGTSSSSCCE